MQTDMQLEALRSDVLEMIQDLVGAEALNLAGIPDDVWEYARRKGWISEYFYKVAGGDTWADEDGYDDEVGPLERLAWRVWDIIDFTRMTESYRVQKKRPYASTQDKASPKDMPTITSISSASPLIYQTECEKELCQAQAEYVAKLASGEYGVKTLRDAWFGGIDKFITPSEARDFLRSPVTRFAWEGALSILGIPKVGHQVSDVWEGWVDPENPDNPFPSAYRVSFTVETTNGRGPLKHEQTVKHDEEDFSRLRWITVLVGGGKAQRVCYAKDSMFSTLVEAGRKLAKHCNWLEQDAMLFILTNEPPGSDAITVKTEIEDGGLYHNWGTITLQIKPWTSPNSVMQTYRNFQRQMLGAKSESYANRPKGSRQQREVFRFATSRLQLHRPQPENEGQDWTDDYTEFWRDVNAHIEGPDDIELVEAWNRLHTAKGMSGRRPKHNDELTTYVLTKHITDTDAIEIPAVENFRRDYKAILKLIVRPKYYHPFGPPQPENRVAT